MTRDYSNSFASGIASRIKTVLMWAIVVLSFAVAFSSRADVIGKRVLQGIVTDSISSKCIGGVSIYVEGENRGVITDEDGAFAISVSNSNILQLNCVGYAPKTLRVVDIQHSPISIAMSPTAVDLNEIEVRARDQRYSKKGNPAVDIIKRLHASMRQNTPYDKPYYSHDKHTKTRIALNDFAITEEQLKDSQWAFVADYVYTRRVTGRPILPILTDEKISKELWRGSRNRHKEVVEGVRRHSLIDVLDKDNLDKFVADVFREVDIFANDITIMQNRFVSPLSLIAPDYYKFFLADTLTVEGEPCVEINFVPHVSESFGFSGRIYLPLSDSMTFVKKAVLYLPKNANVNYVKSLHIVQDFTKAADGTRLKTSDDMTAEFELAPGSQGLYAQREAVYDGFSFVEQPEYDYCFKTEEEVIVSKGAENRPEQFWSELRLIPVDKNEKSIDGFIGRLRDIPFFYWAEQVVKVLVSGYIHTGENSKFDIGPVNTMVSVNNIEGVRFRLGGVTTALLHNRLFARGYVAYGLTDKRLKYGAELEYSFIDKEYNSREFPINSLKVEHNYDIDQIGQHYLFTNKDNLFLSLKRKPDDKATYRRLSKISYKMERASGFSFDIAFRYENQEGTHSLPFINGYGDVDKDFNQAAFTLTLRYAPNEKFYQTKSERIPINIDAPIFILSHEYGPKGFLGSKFTLNRTEFSVQKRFWLSAFGYTDILVKAGKVWSQVQYPALMWPNANLSYTIQRESYSLMNAMEFANDQYVAWDITYWANGALFNRIPLINRLKLREVVSFKGLYGSLSDKNNPQLNNDLYRFPYQAFAKPMGKDPYMELSVGIDNIFTFLRLDYVWRLTYRNTPNVDKSGLRVQLHFTF